MSCAHVPSIWRLHSFTQAGKGQLTTLFLLYFFFQLNRILLLIFQCQLMVCWSYLLISVPTQIHNTYFVVLILPPGYYYVVDSGYTNMLGFLSPYRGEQYHLHDYRGNNRKPRGPKELFSYIHSSLRNGIERCFGLLKARFPILKMMPNYPI